MRLEDCDLNIDFVVSAPIMRTEPEPEWVAARKSGVIPEPAFALYSRASFLSFGAAPPFLGDHKKFLFSYFSMVLRSVKEALVDGDYELQEFVKAHAQVYDPGKKARAEPWDPKADDRARKHFRLLLLSLQAGLDAVADLTALFLTGLIPDLRVGRAQFSRVEAWLDRPLASTGLIVTPQLDLLEQLHQKLQALVSAGSLEQDWLPLMRMFRNKSAHLGDAVFRQVGLHDSKGMFYTFLPRQWPYIWEEHLQPAGSKDAGKRSDIPTLLRDSLVHQDVVTYARGLRTKVTAVISAVLEVVDSAYLKFKDFPQNQAALAELQGNSQAFAFVSFKE